MDCIKEIKIKDIPPNGVHIILGLLKACGCSVSDMPDKVLGQETYSNRVELFDPKKVTADDAKWLPEPWDRVFAIHNRPDMRDCRILKYRYVHVPFEIMPSYPSVPCKGIFCLSDKSVRSNRIKSTDLVHIGEEIVSP